MTLDDLQNATQEHLFVRGFNCPDMTLLGMQVASENARSGKCPDLTGLARQCIDLGIAVEAILPHPDVSHLRVSARGARDRCLAVHEAGHAIVGIKSGMACFGVRFYGDEGQKGEVGFEHFSWRSSGDEGLLRRHIRIDVAANVGELISGDCEPDGGRPSKYFDHQRPVVGGQYPSDIVDAWQCAGRLVAVLSQRGGRSSSEDDAWETRRVAVVRAELEAEKILQANLGSLNRLAEALLRGPMTGADVRAIVDS